MKRRNFIAATGTAAAGTILASPAGAMSAAGKNARKRLVIVGTGERGTEFWGQRVNRNYSDLVEFVGLCDRNIGRAEFAKKVIGVDCPVFTDFDEMIQQVKPDMIIVTTMDAFHHEYIIRGLKYGCDVLTEKPMTTDEVKCQQILDAESASGKKVIVGFNYRYASIFSALKQQLAKKEIGKMTSVDFNWYLNVHHGASYFRRWHGERDKSGTLLVHKATHHFDLLNWLIDSDPVEVNAYGMLEHYGTNNKFRGSNCRNCGHTDKCKFFWDITKDKKMMDFYVANEKYDGYIRDNCLWRDEVDIYDKMSVQIKYANNVVVTYSLTTYSPFEGWRIAFNGMDGRVEAWEDIPWLEKNKIDQAKLHAQEMDQSGQKEDTDNHIEITAMNNFQDYEIINIPKARSGHGGGDSRLQDKIFRDTDMADPLKYAAGTRDGAMSVLIGIAARKSIEESRPVRIEELTDIKPTADRS